ncbi:MAG: ABC transporter ATP-binding protein, partial [Myxococcaceae bacterium]
VFAAFAIAGSFLLASGVKGPEAERFVTFITALVFAYTAAKQLGRVGQMALAAGVSGDRVFEILDLPNWVPQPASAQALPPARQAITLEQVSFAYEDRLALRNLTLQLPVGKVTALVGPSGGGKSTLTALLLRQARPSSGRILIDGVDVEAATLDSVRAQFALVTQEPLLFSTTVRENLLLARPSATRDELEAAANAAQAHGFIRALPLGYDTRIGERGAKLSGGQKQRLCLARALLANAPVLLLDEATSSLDPESERDVQNALATLLPGRTALVIAHRLSTIVSADAIHVLQNGALAESGTHSKLLAQKGLYAQLWTLQQSPSTALGGTA